MALKQPHLTKRSDDLSGLNDANPKTTLVAKPLLNENADEKDSDEDIFHYGLVVCFLSHLDGHNMPDISMTAHKAAKFSKEPKAFHDAAVKRISKYLIGSLDEGLTSKTGISKGLEVHADADFVGEFDKSNA